MKSDAFVDNVLPFKSRHSVPLESMEVALKAFEAERLAEMHSVHAGLPEGERLRWGLSLDQDDEHSLFDAVERAQLKQIRYHALAASQVKRLLGCSYKELYAWDNEGSLPHAFTEAIMSPVKGDCIRLWLREDVLAFRKHLSSKRVADSLKRRFYKSKKPLKVI